MAWRANVFFAFREKCRVGGGKVGMEIPSVVLAARMARGSNVAEGFCGL